MTSDIVGLAVDLDAADLKTLLIRRGREPYEGSFAWPGGFVDTNVDVDARAAAIRELREEAGLPEAGFIETLDTYETNGRDPRQFSGYEDDEGQWVNTGVRVCSKAFLTLFPHVSHDLAPEAGNDAASAGWESLYDFLPWEDLRSERGRNLNRDIVRRLTRWAIASGVDSPNRRERVLRSFATEDWNEEKTDLRYHLLLEAGLVEEAWRDEWGKPRSDTPLDLLGRSLAFDHRKMAVDALQRIRGKIKYAPAALAAVMPPEFTLFDLQVAVETIGGRKLHKSNFRRVVSQTRSYRLVVPTGRRRKNSGHAAPMLYSFDPEVLRRERLDPSIRFPWLSAG